MFYILNTFNVTLMIQDAEKEALTRGKLEKVSIDEILILQKNEQVPILNLLSTLFAFYKFNFN